MADILIVNGIVVTLDGERRVIEDGAVAITADRITAVGTTAVGRIAPPISSPSHSRSPISHPPSFPAFGGRMNSS